MAPIIISPVGMEVAAMQAQRENEECEVRRKSHIGKDQVVYESKKDIDTIGKAIAGVYGNTYYNETEKDIYSKPTGWYGAGVALLTLFVTLTILGFWWMISSGLCYYKASCPIMPYPFDFITSIGISIFISFISGLIMRNKDEPANWVELSEIEKGEYKTRVLLKIYDNRGYRNINEDTVIEIQELM